MIKKIDSLSLGDDISRMPYKDPEKRRIREQTPKGKKKNRIGNWKTMGIICGDWDALYERFMTTTHCENCDVLLTGGGLSRTGKCLDHDHSINDRENVRGVLCHACNTNDKCTNTSGVPNVSYYKNADRWRYERGVSGVRHRKYFKTKADAIRYKYEYESSQRIIAEDANG